MSTPPTPQTTVSQSGMLSRSPGAKNLPSRPMMMPAMITPMMSTDDPFHLLGTGLLLRRCGGTRPTEGAIPDGNHGTTEVRGLLLWIGGPVRSRTPHGVPGPSATRDRIGRPGTARPIQASRGAAGYLSVWSSISASGALRFTDSMPLIALALLS